MTKFMTLKNIESPNGKTTIFVYEVSSDNKAPVITHTSWKTKDFNNILYLGYDETIKLDIFKAWDDNNEGNPFILFGIKGDEFP